MDIGAVKPVDIEEEMRGSYLDYAMSVIVSRALPDVRDGLKPVQRRILYAMEELGLRHTTSHKKSARIVGEVLGKYHPHGDAPVYEAMVRMAQDFSLRYVLIDGQGNFGSVDNDPPAAMRYTEARLSQIAQEMVIDIDKDTVDLSPNFDGSLKEPTVLPTRLPNLLLNGASGIAVGMATNIPPHNLIEMCDAISYLIDNPEATVDELTDFIRGPDFPTAGIIFGREGIKNAYTTGRGKIVVRARADIEEMAKGRSQIVVTELPYQANKAALVERIAELAKGKRIEGIAELRDESDRQGMRIVIELKRDAQPEQVLNNLYKHTTMQSAFFVNMLALIDGQPRVISLKTALQQYIDFRRNVIVRRSRFELRHASERAHILEGLKIALDQLDQVIATIRHSQGAEEARSNLMKDFELTQAQVQAILDMQLRRLSALERKKVAEEYTEVLKTIAYLEDLLANPRKILFLVKEEVGELKAKYDDPRRTEIIEEEPGEFREEDLIPHQRVVITLTHRGYIKRVPSESYRLQQRGGRGATGVATQEAEGVRLLLVADTLDTLLFFTNRGKVLSLRCYRIPQDTSRTAKGTPLIKLISVDEKEQVTEILAVSSFVPGESMIMVTRCAVIKRSALEGFASVRSSGLIAMDLKKDDELIAARVAHQGDEIVLVSEMGRAIRFALDTLRIASRTSGGVRAIHLAPDDRVVAMDIVSPDACLLVVTKDGFGKCTRLSAYRRQARGGSGIKSLSLKTGRIVAARVVHTSDEVMFLTAQGVIIRMRVDNIPVQGRIRRGASLMKPDEGDAVVAIACLEGGAKRL
ncbi:MAG: DNA gyrase subunit A [Dehalococcoidia bacterium]|nr:MAG: DNA gyrase subunit A [Dehalococcoidia bacterium]